LSLFVLAFQVATNKCLPMKEHEVKLNRTEASMITWMDS